MKSFQQKWQECARRARRESLPETPPPGFVAAVLRRRPVPLTPPSWETTWLRFSYPALSAAALLLLIASVIYWRSPAPTNGGLRPTLENAIIEQIQLL